MNTPSIVIIGTGFGGLGMAMELQRAGVHDFVILERAEDVGGVWRENTYPGAGCDIPSPLYSYSYAPRTDWPKRFSQQPDILDYLRGIARDNNLLPKIRFRSEVTDAEYDDATGRWRVRTADGTEYTCAVLISAVGQLSRPALPDIPGVETFRGTAFHSAEWDHEADLTGKRVAVIGTGASAVQFVPAIAPQVAHLTLFQRSAAWIMPKPDVEYRPWHHRAFDLLPITRLSERFAFWAFCEFLSLGIVDVPVIRKLVTDIGLRHLENQVPDPRLRAMLTPDYPAGCKRALFSNDYLPALTRPNVAVETTAITEITPEGVRTADGVLHEVDAIVYGTGFKGTEFLWPMRISGRGGRKLQDEWADGARAYRGMTVPGYPNLFLMYGPNTNLGVGSIVYMIESQARYIRQAVAHLARRPGHVLDVRPQVAAEFDRKLQARLDRTPWNFCSSWYRNAAGRITNNWPGTVTSYRWQTRRFDPADFECKPVS
ncbi:MULTISPECIES: flavin-containing monooxygenase [Nocardia]|uniref:flavin-containing monooxygenase n=2 Tax=Nocardiaceae TaxID=85025 RepID=UPI000BF05238|nr:MULTISPECIES: NAD(P)/FAD-dependent oxidoreductase [Nocardia]MBF6185190.1 NAD(P)/FAD-dependent oxidoreductase [Nocardia farcinica]MBF6311026.1 NAD(P)/FAD-dependent oxidoreductase [Nocardia farcinica]MBF6407645.1 NAD(P)/FAD-dependent oxidoreductase [Nocardia farcinica]PEH79945.1 4-hydroxyacetophenone monooxygenase [Nocardia sp. FDAARGOS_372]UEX21672.1 NAD(P)/FAD-dependent oxidoreductase [Nocardia farcinica]